MPSTTTSLRTQRTWQTELTTTTIRYVVEICHEEGTTPRAIIVTLIHFVVSAVLSELS